MRQYVENGTRYDESILIINRKLHMGFRLAPRLMTLDDLELDGGRSLFFQILKLA